MKEITSKTLITGIFGYPLSHTLSPAMHNKAFEALGLDYVYLPFPVSPENLPPAVKALSALGFKGVNITIPHKEAVMKYLDEVAKEAELIGAVNTIVVKEGKLCGFNTDGSGFLNSLREAGFDPKGKKAVVLGAGGACRAVAMTLSWAGIGKLHLAARSVAKAENLARDISNFSSTWLEVSNLEDLTEQAIGEADLIINTTPVGMYPHVDELAPLNTNALHRGQLVCDLIYNPLQTTLLKEAGKQGCATLNGIGMLVYQGAESFSLWTEKSAPLEVMRQAVLNNVGKSRKKVP